MRTDDLQHGWYPIHSHPLHEEPVLLLSKIHGQIEGRYSPGYWERYAEGEEYNGTVWVLGDDIAQSEIEENGPDPSDWHHGDITHWRPLHLRPGEPYVDMLVALRITK